MNHLVLFGMYRAGGTTRVIIVRIITITIDVCFTQYSFKNFGLVFYLSVTGGLFKATTLQHGEMYQCSTTKAFMHMYPI